MGRAERRKAGKTEKISTYNVTAAQIEQIKRDAVKQFMDEQLPRIKEEATDLALAHLLSIPIVVLRDKFGFGDVRINRFLSAVTTWIKAANSDPETLKELEEIAESEAGYKIDHLIKAVKN